MNSKSELCVLLSRDEIAAAVDRLAAEIRRDYRDKYPLLVGILKGSFIFMADLIQRIDLPLEVDFVRLSSYGKSLFPAYQPDGSALRNTFKVKPFAIEALRLPASAESGLVIEVVPGQIITRKSVEKAKTQGGYIVPDVERDILKLAVVERHRATGNTGLGLVKGFGLRRGALASSIAHDSHNIVAVGTSDEDIYCAIKEIEGLQGGLVAVVDGKVLASLALPIAGLLSDEPLEVVVDKLAELDKIARELGTTLAAPFATLSFLALPVIPELRLTDRGLVDVNAFELVK